MAKKLKYHSRRKPSEKVKMKDLIKKVADDTGYHKKDVEEVLKAMQREMRVALLEKKQVYLEGIGGIFAFLNEERNLKNPRGNSIEDRVIVPACFRPRFQASNDLKDDMKRIFVSQKDIDDMYEDI